MYILDNIPNWEYGVLQQVRDLARVIRNDYSRSQSQSKEDPAVAAAEPRFFFDNDSWILPATESEYRDAIEGFIDYRDRLEAGDDVVGLDARINREDVEALLEMLRAEIRREIVRRLVADRGAEPVARTLREPLVEDIDLMHATRSELERIEAAVTPLARKLATRLAQRRRRGHRPETRAAAPGNPKGA